MNQTRQKGIGRVRSEHSIRASDTALRQHVKMHKFSKLTWHVWCNTRWWEIVKYTCTSIINMDLQTTKSIWPSKPIMRRKGRAKIKRRYSNLSWQWNRWCEAWTYDAEDHQRVHDLQSDVLLLARRLDRFCVQWRIQRGGKVGHAPPQFYTSFYA